MPEPQGGDVTRLLRLVEAGDPEAASRLLPLVYEELHGLARRQMNGQSREHTLQATALVNEAYVRLFGGNGAGARDREHFLALAARAMRSVLVDHARGKNAQRRNAPGERVPLDDIARAYESRSIDLLALDAALARFAEVDPELVRVVEMSFFAGVPTAEIARLHGVTPRTIERDLEAARAWLRREMR